MDSRVQFEQAFAEDNAIPVERVTACRQGDSYNVPRVSRAWHWWKRSREAVVVVLQPAWRPMTEEPPFPFRGDIFADGKVIIGADWAGGGLIHGYWQSPKGERSVDQVTHWKQSNPAIMPPAIEAAGVKVAT